MVCGEFHIFNDLVLDQNVNNNAYPTPLLHESLDVNPKMIMLGIGWYHNIFSHLICNISIILNMILSICPFYFTGFFYIASDQWLHVYHEKYVIDGLNAIDKSYIYQLMYNVQLTGSKKFDSNILMHYLTQNNDFSLAK